MRSLNSVGSVLARSIIGLVSLAVVVAAFGASAAPIFVDFESDIVPTSAAGDFTSIDSSQILFRDSDLADGSNLAVFEFNGSNALATLQGWGGLEANHDDAV
jgi:hypothetical protein